ncbi:GSCOCG00013545001-RA-CDS [Cotesia congregata]|nr:GSCOCG00013545001-RA-CDS [Cotesia congregata]
MSEDYLFECQRAELLGQIPPTEEEWQKKFSTNDNNDKNEDNNADAENLEQSDESLRRIGGGLDELTSILSATQKKINRFKTVCGSLGSLLKVKVNSRTATPEHSQSLTTNYSDEHYHQQPPESEETTDEILTVETEDTSEQNSARKDNPDGIAVKKIDLNEKMGSHLDKLDSLITKAENAQYSMQHQTKQMKKIVKK